MNISAATKIYDSLRPRSEGEVVNTHVIPQQKELTPDFEAMRQLIAGIDDKRGAERAERKIPENDRTT
jgi:hypothetical protein